MKVLDIHTHRFYEEPSTSILNCFPEDFTPFPDRYYSVGFHPWYLSVDDKEDWNRFKEQVSQPAVLAIGETGLDKLSSTAFDIQQRAFLKHTEIASELRKPLVVHCVKAYNEIIRHMIQLKPEVPWIIHGFRGKKELATELISHGFYLSFGEKYQEEALNAMPLDRVFIETDESTIDIHQLYERASSLLFISVDDFTHQVRQNIRNVFFRS